MPKIYALVPVDYVADEKPTAPDVSGTFGDVSLLGQIKPVHDSNGAWVGWQAICDVVNNPTSLRRGMKLQIPLFLRYTNRF